MYQFNFVLQKKLNKNKNDDRTNVILYLVLHAM